mgnify:CR=1 FL=1
MDFLQINSSISNVKKVTLIEPSEIALNRAVDLVRCYQNKNDFDIVVHLLCEGEQEVVSDNIPANSFYSFTNVTDKEYTVGIHADVGVAADIRVVVYDGKDTEPYTK